MTPDEFQALAVVSRETLDRLTVYAALLARWQARINLVGAATLADVWGRHLWDSAQLAALLPEGARVLVDLGSGAGFPGLVLAILGVPEVHLVESDGRKGAFLREAIRVTGAPAVVHTARIEQMTPFRADVVTSRALAPLAKLLDLAQPFLGEGSQCLFLKGRGGDEELTLAAKEWMMAVERIPSRSDPSGQILRIKEVHRGRAQP